MNAPGRVATAARLLMRRGGSLAHPATSPPLPPLPPPPSCGPTHSPRSLVHLLRPPPPFHAPPPPFHLCPGWRVASKQGEKPSRRLYSSSPRRSQSLPTGCMPCRSRARACASSISSPPQSRCQRRRSSPLSSTSSPWLVRPRALKHWTGRGWLLQRCCCCPLRATGCCACCSLRLLPAAPAAPAATTARCPLLPLPAAPPSPPAPPHVLTTAALSSAPLRRQSTRATS